jgi:hypothetical protein
MSITQSQADQTPNPCSSCFIETECVDPLKGKEACKVGSFEDGGM